MKRAPSKGRTWVQEVNSLLTPGARPVLQALDLFCGAGGLSLGFRACGFDVRGIDACRDAVKTYSANLGRADCEDLFGATYFPAADVVIAGPPCQPWSRAGNGKGGEDERDGLSLILDAVRRIRPLAVVVENVPDLARRKRREHLNCFEKALEGLDYLIEEWVLNAADYGVPQNRRRVFIAGIVGADSIGRPKTWSEKVEARRAIPGTYWREVKGTRPVSEGMNAYIDRYERASGCRTPRDLHVDRPARTLTVRNLSAATGDMIRLRLPNGTRRTLTIREAARLQSFPDWFLFSGSQCSKFKQIGNAVPPLLARAVAEAVYQRLVGRAKGMEQGFQEGSYPIPSSASASATMRANRRRDTQPELRLRSALHREGRRFRVDLPMDVSGRRVRPDIVFTRQRVAVFIDGCFWHGCPEHGRSPRANGAYWRAKLRRNKQRDDADNEALERGGWTVVRVWEHEATDEAVAMVTAGMSGK